MRKTVRCGGAGRPLPQRREVKEENTGEYTNKPKEDRQRLDMSKVLQQAIGQKGLTYPLRDCLLRERGPLGPLRCKRFLLSSSKFAKKRIRPDLLPCQFCLETEKILYQVLQSDTVSTHQF